jgi:hypothetical protein
LQAKNDMALNGSESALTALLMVLVALDHGKIDSPFVPLFCSLLITFCSPVPSLITFCSPVPSLITFCSPVPRLPFCYCLFSFQFNSQTIFYLLVYSKTICFCACPEKIDEVKQSCGINHQPKGFVIMTKREIRRYNVADRQGYTLPQTVFFHLAMAALAGLTPFAIAFIIVLAE